MDPANANTHPPGQLEVLKAMLREFGQRLPLVTRASTGILEAGEGRLVAGRALGWRYIPVLPCEDDALTATRFALGDNRSAALAVIDEDRLTEQLLALHEQGVDLQGVYIRRDLIEACTELVPSARLELPPDHHVRLNEAERESFIAAWINSSVRPLLGLLPGARSGDLTVMAPLVERQDLVKRCPWWVELRGVPYDEQWEILRAIVEGIPRFGGGVVDGGNGGWLGEKAVTYFGEQVFQALHLKSWYAEFLPRFRRSFEEHQILVPRDDGVRDDLLLFRINKNGVPHLPSQHTRDTKTGKPRHGDAAIALLLAHSRHHEAPPEIVGFRRAERASWRTYLP